MKKFQIPKLLPIRSIIKTLSSIFFSYVLYKKQYTQKDLIISLTSFPARFRYLKRTIRSILAQTVLPEKICVVLCLDEFKHHDLASNELKKISKIIEVIWIKEKIRSYGKLLPARERYPDKSIITIDDDVLYEDWRISELLSFHIKHPNTIVAHRARKVENKSYDKWQFIERGQVDNNFILTGVGGVLYPPKEKVSLDKIDNISDAILICPTADDIWFSMSVIDSNVPLFVLSNNSITNASIFDDTPRLSSINVESSQNDSQLLAAKSFFYNA